MSERADERPGTAEIAAGGAGGTLERDRIRATRAEPEDHDMRSVEREGSMATPSGEEMAPLFPGEESGRLRGTWEEIQTGFVDDPRQAVQRADELVASVMHKLAEVFADERSRLEQQWTRGDDVSTEDLRVALRRYRSFFDRLLSV